MKVNIDSYTGFLVCIGCYYLVAVASKKVMRWSTSPYDAWSTRNLADAQKVAEKVGGELWIFNPIVGSLKKYKE